MVFPAKMSRPKLYFDCPYCEETSFDVTYWQDNATSNHKLKRNCSNCFREVEIEWLNETQSVNILSVKEIVEKNIPGYILLRIDPSKVDSPVYFIVEHTLYLYEESPTIEQTMENLDYYINEHTCPTNIISIEAIIETKPRYDDDPHGILQFVAWAPKPDNYDKNKSNHSINWREIFPILSTEIDGEVVNDEKILRIS